MIKTDGDKEDLPKLPLPRQAFSDECRQAQQCEKHNLGIAALFTCTSVSNMLLGPRFPLGSHAQTIASN